MENFKLLWDKAIKPLIDDALNKDKRYQINYSSETYKDVEARYNNLKNETKREFMLQNECLLDRHKLCACIYIAITEMKLLKVTIGGSDRKDILFIGKQYFAMLRNLQTQRANSKTDKRQL